jgi:hypothetical protein
MTENSKEPKPRGRESEEERQTEEKRIRAKQSERRRRTTPIFLLAHCNDGLISSFRNEKHTHSFTAIRDGLTAPALEAAEFVFALSLLARSHITLVISDITFLPQMFVLGSVQHGVAVERLPSSERELQRLIAEAALEDVEDSVEENETSGWVKRKKESMAVQVHFYSRAKLLASAL